MKANRGLSLERMVKLGRVSRSGFYRFDDGDSGPDPDMDLRDAIQKIAVEWPAYGRPRMTKELRERGWTVSPKRVPGGCARTTCCACASASSSSPSIPTTHAGSIPTWARHDSERDQSTVAR